MTRSIIEAAPAKINLYLDVVDRRADGYHNIISIMQSVDFSDIITIDTAPSGGIRVLCDNPALPLGRENTVYRAAEAFLGAAGLNCGLEINIEKNIPSPAGLGGGSSDGAATLRGLNKIFGRRFSHDALCRMGMRISADLPFCIRGGCARARGIGELLEPLPPLPDAYIVIACAGEGISTPAAYARLDGMYGGFAERRPGDGHYVLEAAAAAGDLAGVGGAAYNIFEECVLPYHREAAGIRSILAASGGAAALMSGSGPAVYGLFAGQAEAAGAASALRGAGYSPRVCRPAREFDV